MAEIRVMREDLRPPAPPPKRHFISIKDVTRDDVERLLATARTFERSLEREVKKLPTLKGRLVINVFYESSTRTSSSFELAAKRLSADTMSIKSTGSSVDKGESLKDTAITLGAYDPDVIVLRHPQIGAPHPVARDRDDGLRRDDGHRCRRRRGRRLRAAHAARADAGGSQLRSVAAGVHGALGDHPGAAAPRSEGHASRADEPRRRDRSARRRPRRRADRDAGACRARHTDGGPLRPPHERAGRGQDRGRAGGRMMLFAKDAPRENIVVRGARVLDSLEGVDATLDIRVDDGIIAALGTDLETNAHHVIEAGGLLVAPAFVDPNVHLRKPGREDEETVASGTAAAAARGYCAILAMPNTDPV